MPGNRKLTRGDLARDYHRAWDCFDALKTAAKRHSQPLHAMLAWRQMVGYWGGLAIRFRDGRFEQQHAAQFVQFLDNVLRGLRDDLLASVGPKVTALKSAIQAL